MDTDRLLCSVRFYNQSVLIGVYPCENINDAEIIFCTRINMDEHGYAVLQF